MRGQTYSQYDDSNLSVIIESLSEKLIHGAQDFKYRLKFSLEEIRKPLTFTDITTADCL